MTRKFLLPAITLGFLVFAAACGQGSQPDAEKSSSTPAVAETPTTPAPAPFDPDPTDTIPGNAYPAYCSDTAIASMIGKTLREKEKNMLNVLPPEERKFKYHAADLNNDGKNEYMVALYTPMYCGTGGCTAYLLNNDGSVHSNFSVVRFPIYLAAGAADGWKDLVMYSGGENRVVKHKGGKYPSNPSTLPIYKEALPDKSSTILDIWEGGAYPAFSF